MVTAAPLRVQENKVVMAKLPREDFIRLQKHCGVKGESINSVIRKAIKSEIEEPIPHMISGKNLFSYNKYKDNFSWQVIMDNGLTIDIESDLSYEFVAQMSGELRKAVDERNTYIKKEAKESVAIPSKIVRKRL